MKMLFLFPFVLTLNLAYGAKDCSINEQFAPTDNYENIEKILAKIDPDKFSDLFCQGLAVCHEDKSAKGACEFFESSYKNALKNLNEQKLGSCGMSKEELMILKYYTTAGYECFNSHLRGVKTNAKINYLVEVMKNAINKFPAYWGFVRRGTTLPDSIRKDYAKGKIVSDKAFSSSSTFQGFAFQKDQMLILSRTGRAVMTINNGSENEIIFQPDTKFKVLGVKSVNGRNFYVLREVFKGIEDDISDEKILEIVKTLPKKQDYFVTDKWTCPKDLKAPIPKKFKQKTTPDLIGYEK